MSKVCNVALQSVTTIGGRVTKDLGGSGVVGDSVMADCRRLIETPAMIVQSPGVEQMSLGVYITADCSDAAPAGTVRVRSMILRHDDY